MATPGTTDTSRTVRIGRLKPPTSSRAIRGPITAPAVSIARWKPNARPSNDGGVPSAMRASRGDVRTPFPNRSTKRAAKTWGHPKARASSAFPAAESA